MTLIDNLKQYAETSHLSKESQELFGEFISKGFPTIKDEEWKYTSLKKIISESYTLHYSANKNTFKGFEKYFLGFKNKIVFLDGKLASSSNIKGVTISDYTSFKNLSNHSSLDFLNASLSKNGFTISVDENIQIEEPIEILFLNTTENIFSQYRNCISIGKNSSVKFIEQNKNVSDLNSLSNNFTQINCAENSNVEFNKIQNDTARSKLIDTLNVYQKSDSVCTVNTVIFGGLFIRNNLNFEQNGQNAESNMNGITLLTKNQFVDNHTFVDHKNANCRSNELYKGIYLDKSKGVFNGKIMVRKDSQKIDAFQANNSLLLNNDASINSKPQLEIYADDVKCSHGCTIGQLDSESLFYLRSRGVSLEEAKGLLTFAFASEAIQNISIAELRSLVQKTMSNKLNVDIEL